MNDSVWKIGMPVLAIWVLGLTWHALSADRGPSAEGAPVVAFVHGDSLQRGMHLMRNLQANLMAQRRNSWKLTFCRIVEAIGKQSYSMHMIQTFKWLC